MSRLVKVAKRLNKGESTEEIEKSSNKKLIQKARTLNKSKTYTKKEESIKSEPKVKQVDPQKTRPKSLFPGSNSFNMLIGQEVKNFLQWLTVQNPMSLNEFTANELTNFYLESVELPPVVKVSWQEEPASTISVLYEHFTKAKESPAEYMSPGYYVPILKVKANFAPTKVEPRKKVNYITDNQLWLLKNLKVDKTYGFPPERLTYAEAYQIISFMKGSPIIKEGDKK